MMNDNYDPYESADNPKSSFTNEYWGQVSAKLYPVVLVKDIGKVDFDPRQHKIEQRRTAIDIEITLLPEMDLQFPISRNYIAESKEWSKYCLDSLKALGISARELNGKFVKARLVETGETYTNNRGEVKTKTALVFEKVFVDAVSCAADYNGVSPTATPAPIPTSNGNKERETALKFLRVVVENACKGESDVTKIQKKVSTQIAGMPVVNKYFTGDSSETLNLMTEFLK